MQQLQTKYITLDDFRNYFIEPDLVAAFGDETKALAFLKRIEDRMATFLDANFYRNVDNLYPNFTDYQKEHYKLALLEQAIYIFKNSDISVDSGYDKDAGKIISRNDIRELSIAENSRQNLILCNLWNRNVKSRNVGAAWRWV